MTRPAPARRSRPRDAAETMSAPARRVGRPSAGGRDTRADILTAALELFAEHGFERTGTRAVAARAGVDVALIYHHFGNKDELLVQALALPETARPLLQPLPVGTADPGRAVAATFLTMWDTDPAIRRQGLAMVRTALSHPRAAELLRHSQETAVAAFVQHVVADSDQTLRVGLVAAQLSGLILSRHVIQDRAVADAELNALIDAVAPIINHYLTAPLGPTPLGPPAPTPIPHRIS